MKNADPPVCVDTVMQKLECCSHVQKRMGCQLTNKVTEQKGKNFVHNGKTTKEIHGKGGLTKKAILKIQGHFGAAIRNNSGNLTQTKQDIWAMWHHCCRHHQHCGNWCLSKSGKGDPNQTQKGDPEFATRLPL